MATTDFSRTPDADLEKLVGMLELNPEFIPNESERKAVVAEYFRRRSGAQPAPATNVDANLEAAASPMQVEPMVGKPDWRAAAPATLLQGHFNRNNPDGPEPIPFAVAAKDIDEYSEAYKNALAAERVQSYARADARVASGYKDPRQEAYNAEAGVVTPESAAGAVAAKTFGTAEDVANASDAEIAAYIERTGPQSALGGPMRRASPSEIAAARQFLAMANANPGSSTQAMYNPAGSRAYLEESERQIKERAQANIDKYGYSLAADQVTPAQRANREQMIAQEDAQRARQIDLVINRIAQNTGAPRAQVRASLEPFIDDKSLTMAEVRKATQGFRDAANDARDSALAAKRDYIRERGMLFGSNQRLNVANQFMDMPDDWQNFVRAGGRGATPLDVEGRQLDQATRLAGQAVMGAIAGGAGNDTALKVREDQRMQELRTVAGKAKNDAWGDDTAAALKALERAGATAEQREAIMTELFGPGWQDAAPARPRPAGRGDPGRVPDRVWPKQ